MLQYRKTPHTARWCDSKTTERGILMKKLCLLLLAITILFTAVACTTVVVDSKETTSVSVTTTEEEKTTKEEEPVTKVNCTHDFKEATCTMPKTCKLCNAREGEPLPHDPTDATCTEPSTCRTCNNILQARLGHNYVNKKCTRCQAAYPYITVACVGDSITKGGYWKEMGNYLSSTYKINGYGVSGSTGYSQGLDGNPPKPLAYVDQPAHEDAKKSNSDIYVIMLGTNDSKSMNADNIAADGGAQYKADMIAQINEYKALSSDPKIFIALPPVSFRPENGGISNVNIEKLIIPLLQSVALETGAIVIDTHSVTIGKSSAFPDGVHPNDEGKRILAKAVAEAILASSSTPTESN